MTSKLPLDLIAALDQIVTSPIALIASDFDGTIARICDQPTDAAIDPAASTALRLLSELPNTQVCVISGRSLFDLRARCGALDRVRLIGSHGGEFDTGITQALSETELATLEAAKQAMADSEQRLAGSFIEQKPHGLSFHYRCSNASYKADVIDALALRLDAIAKGFLRRGKEVLEFAVRETNKGIALERIQQHTHSSAVLFIGDDITDEDAFARIGDSGVSVKVGPEPSLARFRVDSVEQAVSILIYVAEQRQRWFADAPVSEIQHHLMLSDLRTSVLIDTTGAAVWLCFPRVDSAPIFGALVGGPAAGSFSVRLKTEQSPTCSYLPGTMVGETSWDSLSITDFLDCSNGRTTLRAGRTDLFRIIRGTGTVESKFAPRLDFGRIPTRIARTEYGLKIEGVTHPITLYSPGWEWQIAQDGIHSTASATRELRDETVVMQLRLGTANPPSEKVEFDSALEETTEFWRSWSGSLKLPTVAANSVEQSARVLRALTYGPTGAVLAAATTSLPEGLGGMRNWDYRYCWIRDGAFATAALARLGVSTPGIRFLDWLLEIVDECEEGEFLSPLYSVLGRHLGGEAEVAEAVGYRGSRPVRIGNLAAHQLQLDTIAPVIELLYVLHWRGADLTPDHVRLIDRMVELVQARWREPDSGIWEIRGRQRNYVHSKLMCWYTVARARELMGALGYVRSTWEMLEAEIRSDIEARGFSETSNSYVCAYDLEEPDAALLWIVLTGFHPPTHSRSIGVVKFITAHLLRGAGVFRYALDDGLSGEEGSFHICLAWLIQAMALQGAKAEAQELFDKLVARTAPLGLLSEQWDPIAERALGNFPQAYSHTGLIDAALVLSGRTARFR